MLRDDKLDFWILNKLNVLFTGKHGVGKTARIIEAFERNKLKWKYFSTSTLDPFADFCGIPKAVKNENGEEYLQYIMPKFLQNDEIEAIFFDEYSRSHRKIRNAIMELIQFKSINGKKFSNLRLVWAAVNPDDGDYDVERVDPAQLDRFHVHVQVPYEPDADYFTKKYGLGLARAALSWWDELPPAERDKVSPRRLDYALELYNLKGDLRDVLPTSSNIGKLQLAFKNGPVSDKLDEFLAKQNLEEAKKFLENENNFSSSLSYLLKSKNAMSFYLPLLSSERLTALMATQSKVVDHVINECKSNETFTEVVKDIIKTNQNRKLVRQLKRNIPTGILKNLKSKTKMVGISQSNPPTLTKAGNVGVSGWIPWSDGLSTFGKLRQANTYDRVRAFEFILNNIPATLDVEEANNTLLALGGLASRFQAGTLKTIPKFMHVVNLCLANLEQHGFDWIALKAKNANENYFSELFNKLEASGLDKKLYVLRTVNLGQNVPHANN